MRDALANDSQLFERVLSSTEVRRYRGGPVAPEDLAERVSTVPGRGVFVAERLSDLEPLGLIYLGRYRTGDLELSWELLPEFWRNGYATEACAAVLEWAFGTVAAGERIIAVTQAANVAYLALAARLGMSACESFEEWGEPQVMLELRA
jgi:RimJ/RimL family protein N-acetyltransferase